MRRKKKRKRKKQQRNQRRGRQCASDGVTLNIRRRLGRLSVHGEDAVLATSAQRVPERSGNRLNSRTSLILTRFFLIADYFNGVVPVLR
jgi:hypothetical protein